MITALDTLTLKYDNDTTYLVPRDQLVDHIIREHDEHDATPIDPAPTDLMREMIRVECGEEWGDGEVVMEIGTGYAEPGYGRGGEALWAMGNWNTRGGSSLRQNDAGEWYHIELTRDQTMPVRLGNALEIIGVECEWYDEWATCGECYRAMRTQPNSYGWTMYGAWVDDVGYVCADCMRADAESYIEPYLNNADNALTWLELTELTALGFVQYAPDDPKRYENGFHPGQTDDPKTVLAEIAREMPGADVVFFIDDVGQFDVRFSAWARWPECSGCGTRARCDDAAYGEPTCEACLHATDWHRGCDAGMEPTVCPMCGDVLATHDHATD